MRSTKLVFAAVFSSVLVIAACSSSSTPKAASTSSSSSASTSSSSSSSSSASTSNSSATSSSTLSASTNASIGKQVVVDGSGKTVYLYEPDGSSTTSKVPAGLKSLWPAVPAPTTLTAGPGLDQSKLTAQAQADGTMQLAYNGHLLYTFTQDSAPGDANGQGLGGIWFTLSPSGDKNA